MEATVPGGGVTVPSSPGSGTRSGGAQQPQRGSVGGGGPVPISELTVLPQLVGQPSRGEMRAAYPEAARRDGVEADVRLRLLVGQDGRVSRVKLVRRAGRGFDEVAVRMVRRFRFRPGQRGAKPVPVWIPWTYKFRLAG